MKYFLILLASLAVLGSWSSVVNAVTISELMTHGGYAAWWSAEDYNTVDGLWVDRVKNRTMTAYSTSNFVLSANTLTFDGVGYFNGNTSTNPLNGVMDYTILAEIKTSKGSAGNAWYNCVSIVDSEMPGVQNDWGLALGDGNKMIAGLGNQPGNRDYGITSTVEVCDGNNHIATYRLDSNGTAVDNARIDMFVDGTSSGFQKDIGKIVARNTNGSFRIGKSITSVQNTTFMGDMSQIRFFSRALVDEEITAQTNEMKVTDATAAQYWNGSATSKTTGAFWLGTEKGATNAMLNSGANLYMTIGTAKVDGALETSEYLFIGTGSATSAVTTLDMMGGSLKVDKGVVLLDGGEIRSSDATLDVEGNIKQYGGMLSLGSAGSQKGLNFRQVAMNNELINTVKIRQGQSEVVTREVWDNAWQLIDGTTPNSTGVSTSGFLLTDINNPQYNTITYTGSLRIDEAGTYGFKEICDDGIFLYIDNQLVLEDYNGKDGTQNPWDPHDMTVSGITLDAGYHDIMIRYYQGYGGAKTGLNWQKLQSDGQYSAWKNINLDDVLSTNVGFCATDMNVTGDLAIIDGMTTLDVNLDTMESDTIIVSGDVTALGGELLVYVHGKSSWEGKEFQLFSTTKENGVLDLKFDKINFVDAITGEILPFNTSNLSTMGTVMGQLPEPTTWMLLMCGILFLIKPVKKGACTR